MTTRCPKCCRAVCNCVCKKSKRRDKSENSSPCCGADLKYENDYYYRCGQCGKLVHR